MSKILCGLFAIALLYAGFAAAQDPAEARHQAIGSAYDAALAVATPGPAQIPLGNEAVLSVPAGQLFFPKAESAKLMSEMGNHTGDTLLGMVVPADPKAGWMVIATFEKSGYIKDDDARDWKSDEMLKSLQEGTETQNEYRREHGIPEFVVSGWVQPPTYDAKTHRLVWSAELRDKGAAANADAGVNYNTYALGREGFISLNLITDLSAIADQKPVAQTLLGGLQFNPGKRYEEFNAKTDHIAEFGLAALVGGLAAKKLGLFAVAAAFVLKFAKIIIVAVGVSLAGLKKYLDFRKRT